jgi:hypothetical protein
LTTIAFQLLSLIHCECTQSNGYRSFAKHYMIYETNKSLQSIKFQSRKVRTCLWPPHDFPVIFSRTKHPHSSFSIQFSPLNSLISIFDSLFKKWVLEFAVDTILYTPKLPTFSELFLILILTMIFHVNSLRCLIFA